MAADSNAFRDAIFGKVAHLVLSERGLVKSTEKPLQRVDFKMTNIVLEKVDEQIKAAKITDSMVIEVYVRNQEDQKELLMERWQMNWSRKGREGIEAWIGMHDVDKTAMVMFRRVALSARNTQIMRLLKKMHPSPSQSQFDICYKILPGPSTLHFPTTDTTKEVIFHGHPGHTSWHISNSSSLSFTLNYRTNAWTPRSMPHHIGGLSIIDDYVPLGQTAHSAGSISPALHSNPVHPTSAVNPSPSAQHNRIYNPQGGTPAAPLLHGQGQIPPTSSSAPKMPTQSFLVHGPSPPQQHTAAAATATTTTTPSPHHHQHHFPSHQRQNTPPYPPQPFSPQPIDDDYSVVPPLAKNVSAMHGTYFGTADGSLAPPYTSQSLPKPSAMETYMSGGTTGFSPVNLGGGPPSSSTVSFSPVNRGSDLPSPRGIGIGSSFSLAQSPTDRPIPGSGGSGSTSDISARPVRVRSASSTSASVLAGTSTSISPYRVDLASTMTKSPPATQSIHLPLDMIGGPSSSKSPSSGKVSGGVSFGPNVPITTALAAAASSSSNASSSIGPYRSLSGGLERSSSSATNALQTGGVSATYGTSSSSFTPEASGVSLTESISLSERDRLLANNFEDYWAKMGKLPPVVLTESPFIGRAPALSHERSTGQYVSTLLNEITHFVSPFSRK